MRSYARCRRSIGTRLPLAFAGRSDNHLSYAQSEISTVCGHFLTKIAQVWRLSPTEIALTQLALTQVTPGSSSAPTTKSSVAQVPAVIPPSLALFLALRCPLEESLRRISAGCFNAGEGEKTASVRTCGAPVALQRRSVCCTKQGSGRHGETS